MRPGATQRVAGFECQVQRVLTGSVPGLGVRTENQTKSATGARGPGRRGAVRPGRSAGSTQEKGSAEGLGVRAGRERGDNTQHKSPETGRCAQGTVGKSSLLGGGH